GVRQGDRTMTERLWDCTALPDSRIGAPRVLRVALGLEVLGTRPIRNGRSTRSRCSRTPGRSRSGAPGRSRATAPGPRITAHFASALIGTTEMTRPHPEPYWNSSYGAPTPVTRFFSEPPRYSGQWVTSDVERRVGAGGSTDPPLPYAHVL